MFRRDVSDVLNTSEMRARARRLPKAIFDVIDGGASDEITLRANQSAFQRIWFRPRALADVSTRDLSTTVFGERISMPLMLGPCGFARMARSEAELAIARAAGHAGTVFAVSGSASYPLETIAAAASGRGVKFVVVPQAELEAAGFRAVTRSERVLALTGVPSVSEAAALAAAGRGKSAT